MYEAWKSSNYSKPWCYENFVQDRSLRRAQDVRKQLLTIMDRYKLDLVSAGKNYNKIRQARARQGPAGSCCPAGCAGPDRRVPAGTLGLPGTLHTAAGRAPPQPLELPLLLIGSPCLPHRRRTADGGLSLPQAICSGFFFHAARKDPQEGYKTVVEQTPVFIHPSSALFQRQPDWVIYFELVLTSKEYMREVGSRLAHCVQGCKLHQCSLGDMLQACALLQPAACMACLLLLPPLRGHMGRPVPQNDRRATGARAVPITQARRCVASTPNGWWSWRRASSRLLTTTSSASARRMSASSPCSTATTIPRPGACPGGAAERARPCAASAAWPRNGGNCLAGAPGLWMLA